MGTIGSSARELWESGVDATNARRFAAARRALDAAAAATDDPDLLARIDGTRAYVLGQTGEPAAAEALCREALARPGLDAATVGLLHGQLGTLLTLAGRLDEASAALSTAIEAAAPESIELANLLMNRSMLSMQRRTLADCADDLQRAARIYEAGGDADSLAQVQHNLGYTALLRGDLVEALELMSRARRILAEGDDLTLAISDQDRAEVLRDAGLISEAEELLEQAAKRFGAQRMRQARAETEFHLARSLLRHDPARAVRVARAAARRFRALGSESWAARTDAVRLDAELAAGRIPEASEFVATADALRDAGFPAEATAVRLGGALASHRRDGSTPRLPRVGAGSPTPLRLRAAEVRAARARPAEARRIAAEGLDLLGAWQRSFGALDLQASVAMHGTGLIFRGLRAASASGDARVLFDWSERARHLSQQVAPVRPPHDPEMADDLAELRMLRADLSGTEWTTHERVLALRDRVRERQWSSTGAGEERPRATLAQVQQALDAGTAVLSYVYTEDELLCVVITASDARIVPCDLAAVRSAMAGLRADLDVSASVRTGPLAATVARAVDDRMLRLSAALVAPALPAGVERLVLTAPGLLAGIPWGMLPELHGIPFTLATSVSRWLDLASSHRGPVLDSRPRLAHAKTTGPREQDGASTEERGRQERRGTRAGFAAGPRVARGGEEIARAGDRWHDAERLEADAATVAAVTALAARSDVLHIAAHGRHAVDNPLFAGFELADGPLFGYDVDLIPTPPQTVVLSACELGRSTVRWGEEALGMTRVWLHAGSRSVIAAPAVVRDDDACELLSELHVGLSRGDAPAVALAEASDRTGLRTPFQVHGSGF